MKVMATVCGELDGSPEGRIPIEGCQEDLTDVTSDDGTDPLGSSDMEGISARSSPSISSVPSASLVPSRAPSDSMEPSITDMPSSQAPSTF